MHWKVSTLKTRGRRSEHRHTWRWALILERLRGLPLPFRPPLCTTRRRRRRRRRCSLGLRLPILLLLLRDLLGNRRLSRRRTRLSSLHTHSLAILLAYSLIERHERNLLLHTRLLRLRLGSRVRGRSIVAAGSSIITAWPSRQLVRVWRRHVEEVWFLRSEYSNHSKSSTPLMVTMRTPRPC